jgi:hypothetical protein
MITKYPNGCIFHENLTINMGISPVLKIVKLIKKSYKNLKIKIG